MEKLLEILQDLGQPKCPFPYPIPPYHDPYETDVLESS